MNQLDELCINTIRFLSADAVQKAKSGHPGLPMGAAAIGYVLWNEFLKHNPADPHWPDRDRFVLSAGHGSMLLYSLLYLTGYDLSLGDIEEFRQWRSKTPGHPEYGVTPGVETTTGPLGQGFANGVGMAMAERHLAATFNRPGREIVNHYTYGLVSDGDLEEGVSAEAASLAGHLKLHKLIYLYDSNHVQQDGGTDASFTEDVAERFRAYHWNVIGPIDGLNVEAIKHTIQTCRQQSSAPSLVICRTIIGYGSPHKAGTNEAHGEPLGEEEVRLAKKQLGWTYSEPFAVPPEALAHLRQALEKGKYRQEQWSRLLSEYRQVFPSDASRFEQQIAGQLPDSWDTGLDEALKGLDASSSTRDASGRILNYLAGQIPALLGGAADLAGSTRTLLKDTDDYGAPDYSGRNLRFGLREHAMGSIANGLAVHGGIIPFAATFLIFSDYMRPSIRLASLMGLRVIYVLTHDSIGLGEDGPTHQPVEQIMSLRMIPNMVVFRPADAAETAAAWRAALARRKGPTALILTRQRVPALDGSHSKPADGPAKGGYILWESESHPQVILIGTGSETHLALKAGRSVREKGIAVRVVSLPSWEIFAQQPWEYRESVLPAATKARVSIEAGTTIGWERFVGVDGIPIGLDRFGASAPGAVVFEKMGITAERVTEAALTVIDRMQSLPLEKGHRQFPPLAKGD